MTETDNVISLFSTPQERAAASYRLRERQRERRHRRAARPAAPTFCSPPEIGTPMVFVTANGEKINGWLVDIDDAHSPPAMVVRCADGVTRTGPLIPFHDRTRPDGGAA